MNENGHRRRTRSVRAWSWFALVGIGSVPLAAACGGSSNTQPAMAANGATSVGQPPAGTPGTQGYPQAPGYPPPQQGPYAQPQQQPPPGYPGQAPAYPQQQPPAGYPQSQPQPAPTASTPPPLAPTDPNSLQGILNGLQGALSGTLVSPGGLAGDVTEAGLKAQALRVAPGMQPEGAELKQALSEGQHAVEMITLQAGKCYAIVGFSPLGGVKNLDLNLLAPPLYMTLAGQDLTHNNTPTIGAAPSPMCPVLAFPLQYKLDVFAQSGGGQVAVQLYSKTK